MRAFTALVNPVSGGGKAAERWAPLAAAISAAGADVRVELTRSREHAVDLAAAAADADRIAVAVGGDGLVRDVAEGVTMAGAVRGAPAAMGIVPAGRGNDLARGLGLPSAPDALAQLLLTAEPRPMDVIELGSTIVPGNVYCGIDSVANSIINDNRRIPGALLYRIAPLRAIVTWRPAEFTLTLDGAVRTVRAHSVVVGNSGWYGRGLHIVPSARIDDGLLDVLIVGDGPRSAIASFMQQAKSGAHVHRPEVQVVQAREVRIEADRPVPVCGDGENLTVTPAQLRLRPAAVTVVA